MILEIHASKLIAAVGALCITITTGGVGYAIHQEGRISTVEQKVESQKATLENTNLMVRDLYSHLLNKQPEPAKGVKK